MIPNPILGARKIGQMIWGSSAVQSLTSLLCPEVYENFSACWSQSLEACAIFHSAQLQFLQGFPFPSTHPLHSSPWQPPHCYGQPIRIATM